MSYDFIKVSSNIHIGTTQSGLLGGRQKSKTRSLWKALVAEMSDLITMALGSGFWAPIISSSI